MDGFCNQNADQLGSLAGLSFPVVYVGVVECTPASLSPRPPPSHIHAGWMVSATRTPGSLAGLSFPAVYVGVVECAPAFLPHVILPHTYTQDGWFLQPERRPARLPHRTIFSRCICRCSRMRARLSPPRHPPSHIHAGWMVSATRTPTCSAPSQDYLFSRMPPPTHSSTHRFPDERTPIEATPLSATSAELGLVLGLGLGLGSHSSSHAPLLLATLLSHNIPLPRVH